MDEDDDEDDDENDDAEGRRSENANIQISTITKLS